MPDSDNKYSYCPVPQVSERKFERARPEALEQGTGSAVPQLAASRGSMIPCV
jgi:hypothetical protein